MSSAPLEPPEALHLLPPTSFMASPDSLPTAMLYSPKPTSPSPVVLPNLSGITNTPSPSHTDISGLVDIDKAKMPSTGGTPLATEKKPGRPSKAILTYSEAIFKQVDDAFHDGARMTGLPVIQLVARWIAQDKGAKDASSWNAYLKYFAFNKEEESAHVGTFEATQGFHAKCYVAYWEKSPNYKERLVLFEELETFSAKGMTVAQRRCAFQKYSAQLIWMVSH